LGVVGPGEVDVAGRGNGVGDGDGAVLVTGRRRLAVGEHPAPGAALGGDPDHVGPVLGRATVVGVGRRVPHAIDVHVARGAALGLPAEPAVAGVVGAFGSEGLDRPVLHAAVVGHLGPDVDGLAGELGAVVGRLPLDEGGLLAAALGQRSA